MIGAIIGDIVGSIYEWNNHRSKDFPLFGKGCFATDDSIMSLAVAKALLDCNDNYDDLSAKAIKAMQEVGRPYPRCGYGGAFYEWMYTDNPKPYNSFGNGAAMRISAVGFVAGDTKQAKELARKITKVSHNHPEGIKGAESVAVAIVLARQGKSIKGTSRNTGSDKQTYYKLSLAGADGDSVREMAQTLFDGGGVNGDCALVEAAYSVRCFMRLVELGVPFPANAFGEYVGYKTDHDPRNRATSCGPLTSKLMTEALERSVMSKNIGILDGLQVIKIIKDGEGHVSGVAALDRDGKVITFGCRNVILATGGPAGIYYNTVYPESQTGATGLAIDAGAACVNLEEWQYGIASVKFRWNVSGTYQQVLPRYISVDRDGNEREFLKDALGDGYCDAVFLKGYQWPFDTRKADGSSRVDMAVYGEISRGRRVYMDFLQNPSGLDFERLSDEAKNYLKNSGALSGTPVERLEIMNRRAIKLYAEHGIDLYSEPLEIAVCAQHCNGGVAVDADWQTTVPGLFCAGEAAGTFGVYRPGGSALNSTQVGSLRAAEFIARQKTKDAPAAPDYRLPAVNYRNGNGAPNVDVIRSSVRRKMSDCAAFIREPEKMRALLAEVSGLCEHFTESVTAADVGGLREYFKLYDILLTQRSVLSAMIFSATRLGTHGSSLVPGDNSPKSTAPRDTVTLTVGDRSRFEPVRPIPDAELWFEKVLNGKKDR